jgi:hypothetical protein
MGRSEALIKAQKKYFEKMKQDPDFLEDRRKRSLDYYHKNKENEEYKIKQRARAMKYYYKNKERLCAERREKYRIKKLSNNIENENTDCNSDLQ